VSHIMIPVRSLDLTHLTQGVARRSAELDGAFHGRLTGMIETVSDSSAGDGLAAAARLLHDFNVEYDEPAPPPDQLAVRLRELIEGDQVMVLLARAHGLGTPVGVAAMRVQPSLWSPAQEAYLAELYVVPGRRGQGYGRELITEAMRVAREQGADYAFLVTSEDDRLAQRLYEAAGFRRTEGEGGPLMLAYEREL
jgi:GNAT superfamily N-acetyltransferase